jgi:hypothetical protein
MNFVDKTQQVLSNRESNPDALRDSSLVISDRRFNNQLVQVQSLKNFLFEEKVRFNPEQLDSLDLGALNNLRQGQFGRAPSSEEWRLLDEKLSVLASYLTDELRQKIRIRELGLFFGPMPLAFSIRGGCVGRLLFSSAGRPQAGFIPI